MNRTYNPLEGAVPTHFLGSRMLFIVVVNSAIFGILGAAVAFAASAGSALGLVIGVAAAVGYLVTILFFAARRFIGLRHRIVPMSSTPGVRG